jgi:HD-GYP domain-containing protein (c-di-GMP phosphodiesterase class II)
MKKESHFITTLMIAIANCSLYTEKHGAFDELAEKTLAVLGDIHEERIKIMIIDNELVVNNSPQRDSGVHKKNLIKRLKRKGISRVDFLKGLTPHEIKQFIIDMSHSGKELRSFPHIQIGSVNVNTSIPTPEADSISYSVSEENEKVKEAFSSASPFRKMNVTGLEEVVVNFIATFKKEASILKYLSPVKSFSEYTYTHATNVTVLSVLQAESLALSDDLLHEVGIAALLHDAGKLFIPKDILEKKGKLDDREFAEIKKHPLYGASYLAKNSDLTPLVSVIAFEHHMKYDGSGYPDHKLKGRKQNILSQIVAIADFFDALRSHRPYRGSMEIKDIFVLMKKGAGIDFNPFLVDNFIRVMQSAVAA